MGYAVFIYIFRIIRVPEKEPFKDGWSDDGEIQYVEEQLSKVNRLPLNTAVSGML